MTVIVLVSVISDVLLWTPTYGQAKAGRPARTYIQQLCADTGCSPEDLSEAMNDREKWREKVKDIRASGTTWWWYQWVASILRHPVLPNTPICLGVESSTQQGIQSVYSKLHGRGSHLQRKDKRFPITSIVNNLINDKNE